MAKLNKINSGLIFKDDFSEKTLMWTLSPSDSDNLSFGDNGLQIKHNNKYTTYTIVEPIVDEYSCVVHLDHIPANYNDIAGIIVMANTKDYIECQTFLSKGPSSIVNTDKQPENMNNEKIIEIINKVLETKNYVSYSVDEDEIDIDFPVDDDLDNASLNDQEENDNSNSEEPFIDTLYNHIKFTKTKDKYTFWASETGSTWIEIGSVRLDKSGVIGFFIYSTDEEEIIDNSHFFIKSFDLYTGKYLVFNGLDKQYEVEVFDSDGNIIFRTDDTRFIYNINRSSKKLMFNSTSSPMPIKNGILRLFEKEDYTKTIAQFELGEETFGGDSFTLEKDIRLFINDIELDPGKLHNLGAFSKGDQYIKLSVQNFEEHKVYNISLKILKYSEYYQGEEEVEIALVENEKTENELEYFKELIIPEINPTEGIDVFIKLANDPAQNFFNVSNDYRFKILLE